MANSNENPEAQFLVCTCNDVSRADLRAEWEKLPEAFSLNEMAFRRVSEVTMASTNCGNCEDLVRAMIDEFIALKPV